MFIIVEFGDASVIEQVEFSFEVANLQLDWIRAVSEVATTSGKLLITTILNRGNVSVVETL